MGYYHRCRRTGDTSHVVMFGNPVAVVAGALTVLRKGAGIVQRVGSITAFANGRKIQYRQCRHGFPSKNQHQFARFLIQLRMGVFKS
jgi:hypothetical protein